jgi:catechol 2,3-dioxygenase-like lactoylglutathione lyase family enzyme
VPAVSGTAGGSRAGHDVPRRLTEPAERTGARPEPDLLSSRQDGDMSILGFPFVGVRTERFGEVRALYRDVLGMSMIKDEPQAAWFVTAAGDQMHVYGPGDDDHDFFLQGPVVGLQVDDFAATRDAMVAAGIRFIGEPQTAGGAIWNHYYGPDGNVYEIMQRSGGS